MEITVDTWSDIPFHISHSTVTHKTILQPHQPKQTNCIPKDHLNMESDLHGIYAAKDRLPQHIHDQIFTLMKSELRATLH